MPGINYFGFQDVNERSNVFSAEGSLKALGLEVGTYASGWALEKYATRQKDAAKLALGHKNYRHPAGTRVKGTALGGRLMNPAERAAVPAFQKATAEAAKSTANFKHAKSLKSIGRGFGLATLVTFGYEIGKSMMDVGSSYRIRKEDLAQQRRKVYDEDSFMDSRAAFTQRQRAIQVIHNSQLGVRSAMGREATYMHY